MIFNAVEKAMTIRLDSLVMSAINNMTAETLLQIYDETGEIDLSGTGVKAINLLALYNAIKTQKNSYSQTKQFATLISFGLQAT